MMFNLFHKIDANNQAFIKTSLRYLDYYLLLISKLFVDLLNRVDHTAVLHNNAQTRTDKEQWLVILDTPLLEVIESVCSPFVYQVYDNKN